MAEDELDPTVIKRTQDTLGKYVKKPPLTEKLLKKPPFRFLHDVFKAVIRETGFFDGLYNADELNFENIKDREDKMRFLQKMIDVVKLTTQSDLNVRTSKIVAGHEPERTNELLQMMSEIIEKQLNWKDAVKAIANGTGIVNGVDKDNEKQVMAKKKEAKSDKPKDTTKSKPKVKESKPNKESRENKNSKNATPSPDEKMRKTIKVAPKTKEKTLSRQSTIEKVAKEPKEKEKVVKKSKDVADKTKTLKTVKDAPKRMSPSTVKPSTPIQNATNVDKSSNGKVRQKSIDSEITNGDMKETKKASNETLTKRYSKENLYDNEQNDVQRHASKHTDELQPKTLINTNENLTNGEIHDSAGSQKSSANDDQKNLSSKKRHSSAKKSHSPTEHDTPSHATQQTATESSKSLKTVNENDILTKDTKVELNEKESKNQQQSTNIVKREPTFTHENSRDSVGSNSNSSTTRPRTSLRPPSARPPSARPGAPRRRDKNVEIILQPNDQIKMSNINVKLETFGGDLDDDGENLVIIEDATSAVNLMEENKSELNDAAELEQQGHLVQQILETQKELTQQNGEIGMKGDKDNFETAYDANTRQSSARQMNNLRDIIQTLTKSISPFGKLMDFIPEDIDAMQMELNMWRDTYSQAASDLKRERSLTESATEPMKNQLIAIEANIQEYLEMIDASRVKILQNYDKIIKMLLEQ